MGYKKYHNIKTKTIDGIEFDSRKEARRWMELKMLERVGEINNLQRQVKFLLIPTQYETIARYSKSGRRLKDEMKLVERKCTYLADFVYTETKTGIIVVEDVKSEITRTPEYKIKRKLMFYVHKIKIKEVD